MKCQYCGGPPHVYFCDKPEHIPARKWRSMSNDDKVKATEGHPINRSWLVQYMKFGVDKVYQSGKPTEYYYRNGLFLSYWDKIGWRWQIGGTENMWEHLHTPTVGFVKSLLRALGVPE